VVGSFDQVTTDFGAVIRRINRRFGTSFVEFEHSAANVKKVFEAIDLDYSGAYESGDPLEVVVARPSPLRDEIKSAMRARYRAEVPASIRVTAVRLHDSLRQWTGPGHRLAG
jgi:hypothetical protein